MKKTCVKMIAIVALIGFAAISMIGCSSPGDGGGNNGKTVDKIEITTPPTKLHYNLGEDLVLDGMVVTATYSDGTEEEVTDYEVSGYDKTKAEHQPITVTYKGKTAEFSVNVIDPTLPTVATPTASPEPGTYDEVISVELTTTTPGTIIYYTTDGSEPTEESDVYATAINISETTMIRAFAVKEGYNDSDELVAEYILILPFTSAPELTLEPDNAKITYKWIDSDPVADSYDVYWKQGSGLTANQVKDGGTKITGATSGGEITGLTNNTEYSVIVTAHKTGYTSIDSAVETATPEALLYIITGSGTTFTATKNGEPFVTTGTAIQTVIDAIKTDAASKACIIQFGDGGTALDIGTASASFSGAWGLVELSGKITGSSTTATTGTIVIADAVSVTSVAEIANLATSGNARAIYNASTGILTISGGTVSSTSGNAVQNASTGAVSISGGTVSSTTGYAVNNASTGKVTVSGGTVSATTMGYAVNNASTGTVTISGGTVSTTEGRAVHNNSTGTVNISGGTVSATTTGRAVHNQATGAINISGGTVSATTSYAVYNNAAGKITVSGTALVTSACTGSNGTIYLGGTTGTDVRLEITGGTVENTAADISARAIYSASTGAVNISGGTVRANTGIAVYNNSTGKITVSQPTATPTLITSASVTGSYGTIFIGNSGTATEERLVITGGTVENTASNANARAIHNASTGAVTISGGKVQAIQNNTYAVYNASTGAINISGGTVSAITGRVVHNNAGGAVNISGGTLSATNSYMVYNYAGGTINISGGTVSATTGYAVYNYATGAVNISNGTVSATTNSAVYNNNTGKITVSGTALVTSACTGNNGTINVQAGTLEITGGTVENTSTTTGNAIFIYNTDGVVSISGGTISKTGNNGNYAVYRNNSGATVTIDPAANIVGNNYNITP
jgi:hypothetical protein